MESLNNYRSLLAKVDELAAVISSKYASHIACRAGCDGCCRHLTLSLVEGVALAVAFKELPPAQVGYLRERAAKAADDSPCPLLMDGLCALYAARPLICRTHGLPILIAEGEARRVDFCPRNFQGIDSLPGSALIDLERLNTALAAVNALFTKTAGMAFPQMDGRIPIADALLLDVRTFQSAYVL